MDFACLLNRHGARWSEADEVEDDEPYGPKLRADRRANRREMKTAGADMLPLLRELNEFLAVKFYRQAQPAQPSSSRGLASNVTHPASVAR